MSGEALPDVLDQVRSPSYMLFQEHVLFLSSMYTSSVIE